MIWWDHYRTIYSWIFSELKGTLQCCPGSEKALDEVLRALTPKEEQIIRMRTTMTLRQVGDHFSDTEEVVRQIESKTLRKLRHPNRTKKLKKFLET